MAERSCKATHIFPKSTSDGTEYNYTATCSLITNDAETEHFNGGTKHVDGDMTWDGPIDSST